jgi:hypothetical protein
MRTTVSIDDRLLASAKQLARRRGLTLGRFIEEALRRELSHRPSAARGPSVPVFRGGNGVRPGVDVTSTRALLEALDEGQPVERLR